MKLKTDRDFREHLTDVRGCSWLIEYDVIVDSIPTNYVVQMRRTPSSWEILDWATDDGPGVLPLPQALREYLMTDDSMIFGASKFPPARRRKEIATKSRKWFKVDHQLIGRTFKGRDHLELRLRLAEYVRGNVWTVDCETGECHHLVQVRLPADSREVDLAVREVKTGESCDVCAEISGGCGQRSC